MITETLTVYRGDTDKYGNPHKAAHGSIQGVFAWNERAGRKSIVDKGESSQTSADLYVPRGTDLKARDRVRRGNGDVYAVNGGSWWDQVQPQTGHDFGWIVFQVEAISG